MSKQSASRRIPKIVKIDGGLSGGPKQSNISMANYYDRDTGEDEKSTLMTDTFKREIENEEDQLLRSQLKKHQPERVKTEPSIIEVEQICQSLILEKEKLTKQLNKVESVKDSYKFKIDDKNQTIRKRMVELETLELQLHQKQIEVTQLYKVVGEKDNELYVMRKENVVLTEDIDKKDSILVVNTQKIRRIHIKLGFAEEESSKKDEAILVYQKKISAQQTVIQKLQKESQKLKKQQADKIQVNQKALNDQLNHRVLPVELQAHELLAREKKLKEMINRLYLLTEKFQRGASSQL